MTARRSALGLPLVLILATACTGGGPAGAAASEGAAASVGASNGTTSDGASGATSGRPWRRDLGRRCFPRARRRWHGRAGRARW
jgi:hypothetical protein